MSKISLAEFKTIYPYLSQYRWRYVLGFIFLVAVDAGQLIIPQFIKQSIDSITLGSFEWNELLLLGFYMVAVMAVIAVGRFLWRYFIHGSSRRIEAELRERLFEHLLTLSFDFYQNNKIGDLMARATSDLAAVRQAIGMGLVAFVDGTIMASAVLVIVFLEAPRTALFAIIPLPFITVLVLVFGHLVSSRFRKAQEVYSTMSDTVQETFAGIRVVKSFVKEAWFIKKFADTNKDYQKANMMLVKLYGLFFPLVEFLAGLTSLFLLLIGGIQVVEGLMSAGELVSLFRYFQMLIWPLMGAGFTVNLIQRGAVSLGRINEIMRTVPLIRSSEKPIVPSVDCSTEAAIEVTNLELAYPNGFTALTGIDLRLERGQVLGILGRTGSGKSTLIKTFMRLVDPPRGKVKVFGVDVRDWELSALRALFSVSPQDSYLFSDSIKNNIEQGLKTAAESADAAAKLRTAVEISALGRDLREFQ
ncbi:ABC transporter ATP-binding protein, partial [Breznakiellaceae bacterium SP9]